MCRACLMAAGLVVVLLEIPDGRQAPAAPPAKPLLPTAASSIAADPAAFIGQTVSVTASVDRILAPHRFVLDQDVKTTGTGEVIVLVDTLTAAPEVNAYVTVIGEVVAHEGTVAIRATSVFNSAMTDLARRQAPPVTADEAAFDVIMKRINPAFADIRKVVAAGGGDDAAGLASTLKQGFTETEAFWKKRDKADAVKLAADARTQAEALETAIAAGKWEEAKVAVSGMQQTCSACHSAYRQRGEDGSYRIRTDK